MKKFELFIGYLGNGATVCNKAVEEYGDYKIIAHISECGKIRWRVNPSTVPGEALLKIEHVARTHEANFDKFLDGMTTYQKYGYLLDKMPLAEFLKVCGMAGNTEEKCEYMKNVLYQIY